MKSTSKLLQFLQNEGEADLLPSTIDSYTRQNRYEEAENGIRESMRLEPGHAQRLSRSQPWRIRLPSRGKQRAGSPSRSAMAPLTPGFSPKLPMQAASPAMKAAAFPTICPTAKMSPWKEPFWTGSMWTVSPASMRKTGVSINREPYGPLTGTLVPPCVSHAVAIIEALLAAEQGVKNITVGYGQCGNLIQDVAAIQTLEELTEEYLKKYGYDDVVVTTVLHQWMGGFPADEAKAFGVISLGSTIAALAKATKVIVKTPHEAIGIPTKEANAAGLRCTKQVVNMLSDQAIQNVELEVEKGIIRHETRLIVDKCFELGNGDIALGVCRGVKAGVVDVPFAPCRANAGQMLPARDNEGAVRIMNIGNLPFDKELRDFHAAKMAQRAKEENRKVSFQMVIDDVYAIGKGRLVGRPRY